jgi:ABC-type multidrug transport system fused ATPase/permease subunit
MCIQLFSTFFGGFAVAFVRGWLLALVMLSSIPPVAVAGGIVSRMMTKLSSRMQAKYGDAGDIVEQTIGTIRTVSSSGYLSTTWFNSHGHARQSFPYQSFTKFAPVWFDA